MNLKEVLLTSTLNSPSAEINESPCPRNVVFKKIPFLEIFNPTKGSTGSIGISLYFSDSTGADKSHNLYRIVP